MEFIDTSQFLKRAGQYLNEDELSRIQALLTLYPDKGSVIPGSGGLRKLRWLSSGKGKRGGLRLIYYWVTQNHLIYLLTLYKKTMKEDMSFEEIKYFKQLIEREGP
jgi:mRNA-degrading endonuclease RelE of RelBE toxin-antitoxin system